MVRGVRNRFLAGSPLSLALPMHHTPPPCVVDRSIGRLLLPQKIGTICDVTLDLHYIEFCTDLQTTGGGGVQKNDF
jgi:hypothetical protein